VFNGSTRLGSVTLSRAAGGGNMLIMRPYHFAQIFSSTPNAKISSETLLSCLQHPLLLAESILFCSSMAQSLSFRA